MKYIKQENKKELTLKCVDLVSRTFVELGQTKMILNLQILAVLLDNDC